MQDNAIIRGSTPTHFFSTIYTDIDVTKAENIEIYYMQNNRYILTKSGSDISKPTPSQISVKLTKEDTNKLDPDKKVYIRVLLIYPNGTKAFSANTICADIEDL